MPETIARIQIKDFSMMRFMPRSGSLFAEGVEVTCSAMAGDPYITQKIGDSRGLMQGWAYVDSNGNAAKDKRLVERTVPFSEFDIILNGRPINDLTFLEVISLI